VRSSRTALGLDAGPPVPGMGVAGTLRAVFADATSLPRLVDDVIAQTRRRAWQLPGSGIDPADWLGQGRAHPREMRH
jgi:hypothetical protein